MIKKFDKGVNSDIGKPAIILVVESQDGGYAPIDQRVFDELKKQRRTAERRLNELCYEFEESDRRREEAGERDFDDMVAAEIATLRRQYY